MKDLRRQHKAAQQSKASMDEGFPFMLTEARRVNNTYHVANIPKTTHRFILNTLEMFPSIINLTYSNRRLMSLETPLEAEIILE